MELYLNQYHCPFDSVCGWKYQCDRLLNFGWHWMQRCRSSHCIFHCQCHCHCLCQCLCHCHAHYLGRVSKWVRMISPGLNWNSKRYCNKIFSTNSMKFHQFLQQNIINCFNDMTSMSATRYYQLNSAKMLWQNFWTKNLRLEFRIIICIINITNIINIIILLLIVTCKDSSIFSW